MRTQHCRSCQFYATTASLEGFASPTVTPSYPPDRQLEPIHGALAIRVDISAQRLDVEQCWTIKARGGKPTTLQLDGVQLENVRVHFVGSDEQAGRFEYDGERMTVIWASPFQVGEERQVRISYRVVTPTSGVLFSDPNSNDLDSAQYAVTDHETERARHWLLCVDHPSVRPTLEIELRADAHLTLLANGALTKEEQHDDGTHSTHFSQRQPCPSYLTCFAVGNFVRWDGGTHRSVPIASFALPPFTVEHLSRSFSRTAEMLSFFEQRLAVPFPFDKYYQFAAPDIGGAMENISLVSWDERFLLDAELEREERELFDIVNVHEMAHSWFGDSVVCRDHSHSWLKEGWATYLESCWLEEKLGEEAMAWDLWQQQDAYFEEASEKYQRAIVNRFYDSSFDLFDRHLYPGSGLRLHMLRQQLGDDCFWSAVTQYLTRFAGQLVETDDFRRTLEETSGQSLSRFFDQWFFSPGFPDLKVSFEYNPLTSEGRFEILQQQVDKTSEEGAFHFDLEVAFGEDELGAPRSVQVSARRTVAVFAMPQNPKRVRVDPRGQLLHRLDFDPGVLRLERELSAHDTRGRLQAGSLLSKLGRAGAKAIEKAYRKEPYWGVRASYLDSLGRANSNTALNALLSLGESEKDCRCFAPLFTALGKYRDPRLPAWLAQRLEQGLPYRAQEAALLALGAQRESAPLPVLEKAALTPGYGGFSQAGALRALGKTRQPAALESLVTALAPGGVPRNVRRAAATGLGDLALTLEKRKREQAIETLTDSLRDENRLVALAAATALGTAKAEGTADALNSLAQRLPHQEATSVRRVLRQLRSSADVAAQHRELERLQQRVTDLEDKLERGASTASEGKAGGEQEQ